MTCQDCGRQDSDPEWGVLYSFFWKAFLCFWCLGDRTTVA